MAVCDTGGGTGCGTGDGTGGGTGIVAVVCSSGGSV